jgi:hypothetical protein
MPGSLFPRSLSLQPDSTPSPPSQFADRHSQFSDLHGLNSAPSDIHEIATTTNPSVILNSDGPSTTILPDSSDKNIHGLEACAGQPISRSSETGVEHSLAPPLRTDNPLPKPSQRLSSKAKGKQRADDSLSDHGVGQISGEIRVRGKERELVTARKEQKDKETKWELAQFQDADMSRLEAERDKDKEKIRLLEIEVEHLKQEVSHLFTSNYLRLIIE